MYYTNAKDLYRSPLPRARFKGSSLPQYGAGGWMETANYFLGSDQGQKLMGNLGTVGNYLGMADAADGQMNPYLSTGAGALKGAQMGAKLGSIVPGVGNVVGAVGGALIGGGAALLKARKEEDMREEAELQKQKEEEFRKESLRVANLQTDKGILDTYPTSGVSDAGFLMMYGGIRKKFEEGGVVRPKGDPYEYKKDGDKFLTRKRGSDKWITAKGNALEAIKTKVYKMPASGPVLMDYPDDPGNLPVMYDKDGNAPASDKPVYGYQAFLKNQTGASAPAKPAAPTYNPAPQGRGFSSEIQGMPGNEYRLPVKPAPPKAPAPTPAPVPAQVPYTNMPAAAPTVPMAPAAAPAPAFLEQPVAASNTPAYSQEEVANMQRLLNEKPKKVTKQVKNKAPKLEPKTVEEVETNLVQNTEESPIVVDDPGTIDLNFARDFYKKNGVNKDYIFVVDKPTGAMYQVTLSTGKYKYLDQVGLGRNVGDRDVSGGRSTGGGSNQTQAGWVKINREAEYTKRNKSYGDEFNGFAAYVNGSWKEVPTGIHGTMAEDCGRVSGGCTRMGEELEDTTRDMLDRNTLLYYTSDNSAGIPMQAMGGPTDPPKAFDMSLLAGNTLPSAATIAPQQTIGKSPNALTPTSYGDIVTGAIGGAKESFSDQNIAEAKQGAKDFKTNVIDYAVEHPLDATQIALGTTAIAAGQIPGPVPQLIGSGADVLNGGISFGRSAYYANKGDADKAALYAGFGTVDMAAGVPGVAGDMASIAKMKNLYNLSKSAHAVEGAAHTAHALEGAAHTAHAVQHAAHEISPLITGYKTAGATNDIVHRPKPVATAPTKSSTPITINMNPVDTSWVQPSQYSYMNQRMAYGGKIPTESADYLAEGGEVIQHAPNDHPATDQNGGARALNSNTSLFTGDSHNAPSQGVGVANNQEARIYSKRLYAPKSLVAKLKSL